MELSIQRVTALQTTNGQLTQEVEQVRHITSDQLKHASDSIFKLTSKNAKLVKDVNRLAIIAEQVHLSDTVFAPFPDSAKISPDITCDSLRALMPDLVHTPLNWEYQSDSLSITGIIQKDGVSILSLDLPDTLNERDIVKKVGFLHWGRKYSTEFHHSNSLISINGASVYTVDKTPSWWYRTGKPALAVIISAALTSFILIHAK